jgi:hypothetical protein
MSQDGFTIKPSYIKCTSLTCTPHADLAALDFLTSIKIKKRMMYARKPLDFLTSIKIKKRMMHARKPMEERVCQLCHWQ